jgi:hypothetical protein
LKIAFDEHVPVGLVRMFKSLADERRIRLVPLAQQVVQGIRVALR